MLRIRKALMLLAVLLLVSCQQPENAVSGQMPQPNPKILVGHSLEDMGSTVLGLEEAHFPNPLPEQADYPICCYLQQGDESHRYSQTLEGSYNVISVGMPWDGTGAETVDLMWLQAFDIEDMALPEVSISISGETYVPTELKKYLIWQDNAVAVYDITTFERKMDIDSVVDAFRTRLYQAHQNAVASRLELESMGRNSAFLDMKIENYHVEVLKDIDEFLQKNIRQMIAEMPSE